MATATLSNTPTIINNGNSTTGWGGDSFDLEPDIKVEGTNSVACTQTNNGNNDVYVTGSWNFSTDVHLRLWFNISYVGNLSTTNPVQIFLYDGSNTAYYYIDNLASYSGGWAQAVVYTGNTPDSGSVTKSSITRIGMRFVTSSKPRNVPANAWFDAWTYGDGYTIVGGTSGDEIDWSHIAAVDKTNAYGILSEIDGVFFAAGDIIIGNGTNTTYFKPDGQIVQFKDLPVSSTLYNIEFFDDASNVTNVDVVGGAWSIAGIGDYTITADITDINTFSMDGVQISKAGLINFANTNTHSITNCVFNSCDQVDPSGTTFENNTLSNSTESGGALLYPNTETYIKGLSFINCTNGIEMDTTTTNSGSKTTFVFNDFTFDDVSGKFDVNNTSGIELNVTKNNGSNPNSYTGSVVNFLGASVTTEIKVIDISTGNDIVGARVLIYASDGSNFPYLDSITITGSGTTATVTHTAHGLATGDDVIISGSNQQNYNGAHPITVTGVNTYTYTTPETVVTTPATGTITATFAFINELTNSSGVVSDTRQVNSDQPIIGRVRMASSSPYYSQGLIAGSVSSSTGYNTIIQLIRDE